MKNNITTKSIIRLALACIMLLPLTINAYSAGQNAILKEIRIADDGISITIPFEGRITTKVFTLDNPARWVVDISSATWDKTIKRSIKPSDTKYFTQIRTGQWKSGTARFVIHTKDTIPNMEVKEKSIFISFEKGTPVPEIVPLEAPEPIRKVTETRDKTSKTEGKSTTAELTGDQKPKNKVVEIPRTVDTRDYESSDIKTVADTIRTADLNESVKKQSVKNQQFEILCDGDVTRIMIGLPDEKTFDVRNVRFPDRLIVDYPTLLNLPRSTKLHFTQKSRERLPIGIISYVTIYESQNVSGYNRLMFESAQKFTYKTSVENGLLNIDIRPTKSSQKLTTAKEMDLETKVPQVNTVSKEIKTSAESIKLLEKSTQKFSPPEKRSFIIEKDDQTRDTGHTTPEASLGFRINTVTTGDVETVSVEDMIGTLPEFAKSSIINGGKALENEDKKETELKSSFMIASEPLMIEPPQEFKPLPKGTRPAADLFLTKGESVILPCQNLVRASVGDPEVLVVNVLSQEELLITAKNAGRTTLILWEDGIGRSVRWVNVNTSSLLKTIELERVINDPNIKVSFIGDKTVVLEGRVGTEEEKKRATNIAAGAAEKVVDLIEMLDPRRVLVKVRIVEIQDKDKEDFLKQIGAGTRTEHGDFQFNVLSDILDPEFPGGGIFDIRLHPSIVRGKSGDQRFDPIDIALDYLEQNRKGRILSQPNLVVLSGRAAHFRVGGEIPYTYQNENGFNVVDFREFGIQLDCTPYVDSDNNILLHVEPLVRTPDNTLAIAGIPGFRTREVKTDVQLKDSQTIVIGGLLQHEIVTTKSKIPVLGDVPFVGELFRSKKHSDEKTELLVFLTPIILKDISSVESEMSDEADVSLSPYYQREVIEGMKDE